MRASSPLVLLFLAVASPLAAQTSATLYTDGRVVVRREFPVKLAAGVTTLTLALKTLDPSSVLALDPGVHVLRVRFPGGESDQTLLRRAVGRRIGFFTGSRDTTYARVLSALPLRLELSSGAVSLAMIGQPIFPRELIAPRDTVEITVSSAKSMDRLRLGYSTVGASWRARYAIRAGSPMATISGAVLLISDQVDLDSAEVVLYAGQVGSPPTPMTSRGYGLDEVVVTRSLAAASARVEPAAETIGAHRQYLLPGRYQLSPGEYLLVPLFEPIAAQVERVYRVEGSPGPLGLVPPNAPGTEVPIEVLYRAERPKGSEFGTRALPAGVVSIFGGAEGRETLVGETRSPHIPPNARFEISAGRPIDIRAVRANQGYQVVQDSVMNPNGSVVIRASAQVQGYEWTLTNGSDSVAVAEVIERRPGRWRVIQSSQPADSIDGATRFRVIIPAHGDSKLNYRIRVDNQ